MVFEDLFDLKKRKNGNILKFVKYINVGNKFPSLVQLPHEFSLAWL